MSNNPTCATTAHPTFEEFCKLYLGHEIPAYMKPLLSLLDKAGKDKIRLIISPYHGRHYEKELYAKYLLQLEEAKCAAKSTV